MTAEMSTAEISFPRQYARTQRFSLGVPHAFSIAPDGSRIAFLRSPSGTDRSTCLWVRDVAAGTERLAADPRAVHGLAALELRSAGIAVRTR